MDQLPAHLHYTNQERPGILRIKRRKIFIYQFTNGTVVTAKSTLDRIEKLVIPPMWENVWITKDPRGHIQATGLDLKERKQYIYHHKWVMYRQNSKYQRLKFFGEALPAIRKQVAKDIVLPGWPREKMLALMVMILDEVFIRIGNLTYVRDNGTYGLSTLRRKHVKLEDGIVTFEYKGKSGQYRTVVLEDKELVPLIKECFDLPGYDIFRYYDEETKCYCNVLSDDVNSYLREITGADFSAKDFRTWAGSVLTVLLKEEAEKEQTVHPRKKLENILVNLVAEKLGNTPSVCRSYYIHPTILAAVETTDLKEAATQASRKYRRLKNKLEPEEILTLYLLEEEEKGSLEPAINALQ